VREQWLREEWKSTNIDASTMYNLPRHSRDEEMTVGMALDLSKALVPSRLESRGVVALFGQSAKLQVHYF
jgi:hypothetical protein